MQVKEKSLLQGHAWSNKLRASDEKTRQLMRRLLLGVLAVSANSRAEVALKDTRLEIDGAPSSTAVLDLLLPKVYSLGPLPRLNADEEKEGSDEDNGPFPSDSLVSEDLVVDDRDVQDWEDGDKGEDDGEEEELVAPDIDGPLREVLCRSWLHPEKRSAHVQHLPCQED